MLAELVFKKDFFAAGGVPKCDETECMAVWAKVELHLARIASGFMARASDRSTKAVLDDILAHQGIKLTGTTQTALTAAADAIVEAVDQARAASRSAPWKRMTRGRTFGRRSLG